MKVGDLVQWKHATKPELGIIIDLEEDHIKVVELSKKTMHINWWSKAGWECISKLSEKKP